MPASCWQRGADRVSGVKQLAANAGQSNSSPMPPTTTTSVSRSTPRTCSRPILKRLAPTHERLFTNTTVSSDLAAARSTGPFSDDAHAPERNGAIVGAARNSSPSTATVAVGRIVDSTGVIAGESPAFWPYAESPESRVAVRRSGTSAPSARREITRREDIREMLRAVVAPIGEGSPKVRPSCVD